MHPDIVVLSLWEYPGREQKNECELYTDNTVIVARLTVKR